MWAVVPMISLLFFFGIKTNHAESKTNCVEACPKNWKKMENHCYFWSSDTKKWEEAEEYCKEKRGNLADMTTMTTKYGQGGVPEKVLQNVVQARCS